MNQPSDVLRKIMRSVSDTEVSARELGLLLHGEAGLVERLFRHVGLYYRWLGTDMRDPVRATALLGPKVVAAVVVQHALVGALSSTSISPNVLAAFWSDCVRRAIIARALSEHFTEVHQDDAYIGGFTLEFGVSLLLERSRQHLQWARDVRPLVGDERVHKEMKVFGTTHDRAFARAARAWGLPADVMGVVAAHHAPLEQLPRDRQNLWKVLHWTDHLAEALSAADSGVRLEAWVDEITVDLGLGRQDAWGLVERTLQRTPDVGRAIGVEVGDQPDLETLRSRETAAPEDMDREALLELIALLEEDNTRLSAERDELVRENVTLRKSDPVTKLATHNPFLALLQREVAAAKRYAEPLVLLYVDIDGFHRLNARAGFAAGDQVLKRVAEILSKALRQRDKVARVGPDEFVVLLHTDDRGGQLVAERIRAGVEAARIDIAGDRIRTSVRIAGVTFSPTEHRDHEGFLNAAGRLGLNVREQTGNRVYWGETA